MLPVRRLRQVIPSLQTYLIGSSVSTRPTTDGFTGQLQKAGQCLASNWGGQGEAGALPQRRVFASSANMALNKESPNSEDLIQTQQRRRLAEMQLRKATAAQSPLPPAGTPAKTGGCGPKQSDNNEKQSIEQGLERAEILLQKLRKASMEQGPVNILTDTFGRKHNYLRISITERCNLRCTYCMPETGIELAPDGNLLTSAEIVRLATLFAEAGVNKIRLTGGEPTVRKDLPHLVDQLGSLGLDSLAMTTNGIVLSRQIEGLKAAGLTAVNISLDTLKPELFEKLARRKGHDRVLNAIEKAVQVGLESVKVNVVVMRGTNEDELLDFVEMTRHKKLNVRFIEYMPFDENAWARNKMVTYKEMKDTIEAKYGKLQRWNDDKTEVAKNYQVAGFAGSVSFISSMTEHFCDGCNRLRIMADGNLKVCLFGATEVSLRDVMRAGASDADLRLIIGAAVQRKKKGHAGMDIIAATKNRTMIQIGG